MAAVNRIGPLAMKAGVQLPPPLELWQLLACWLRAIAAEAVTAAGGELALLAVAPRKVSGRRCACRSMFPYACCSLRGSMCSVLREWPSGGDRPGLLLLLHADDVGSIRCFFASWR